MEIPKRLKVGGHVYKVEMADRVETDKGEDNCGDCEWQLNRIRIKEDMPQSQKEETLLHEGLHAADPTMSEDTVARAASAMYQILSRNNLLK